MTVVSAFPLSWPFSRPGARYQGTSKFGRRTIDVITKRVLREIKLLDGTLPVISSNLTLRGDGLPYSDQPQPVDRGVAVYFTYKKRQMCFACDRWDRVQDNLYAIAMAIEALRGIERWGTGDMVEQAFTGFVALPAPKSPHEVLGIRPGATEDEIDSAYRQKAMAAHPDCGGSAAAMAELTEARRKLKEREA